MKKLKAMEIVTGDKDRISGLPDELLVKIISLLPSTEEAFETRLVSKRWQFLWTSTDNLTFIRPFHEFESAIPLVEYAFAQRSSSKIRKFHLSLDEYLHEAVDQWLSYIVKNKVEDVSLMTDRDGFIVYTLPQFLCTCSSLVTLDLKGCVFDKEVIISWKSLKTLQLFSTVIDDETISKLLSGCPALETLELVHCLGFRRMTINNSNIKRLKLIEYPNREDYHYYSLEISAPYLRRLEIHGYFNEYIIVDISSLVSVAHYYYELNIRHCFYDDNCHCDDHDHAFFTLFKDYLQKFRHVTELAISSWFAEVVFMLQLDGVQLQEMKCKCLTLHTQQITKYSLYGVASLLRASPHVETLIIDLAISYFYEERCNVVSSYRQKGDTVDLESWMSNFTLFNLKSVTIICSDKRIFCNCCSIPVRYQDDRDKFCEFSEFLLKKAMVLEKFVIIAKGPTNCDKCSENCMSQYLSQLAAKLLGCPRSSTKSVISFCKSNFI